MLSCALHFSFNRLARFRKMIKQKIAGLLFSLCLTMIFNGLKSQDISSIIISGVEDKISLETYLSGIGGFRFFYSEKLLQDVYLFKTDNGKTLKQFFDQKLTQRGIAYIIYKEKNVVFVDQKRLDMNSRDKYAEGNGNGSYYPVVTVGDPMLAGKFKRATLSGYIRNGKTGEPLPGAVIHFPELDIGIVTNRSMNQPLYSIQRLMLFQGLGELGFIDHGRVPATAI